jgi:transcriptional regulator with XRE-family HTH domain
MARKRRKKFSLKTMGGRIRSIRGDTTQMEFADKLGIRQAMVSRYEADHEIPYPETLLKISRYGSKSIEWLLTGHDSSDLQSFYHAGDAREIDRKASALDMAISYYLSNLSIPYRKEFAMMTNEAFTNKKIMKKLLAYYRYLQDTEWKSA